MRTNKLLQKNLLGILSFLALAVFFQMVSSCNLSPREGTRAAQALRGKSIFETQCISCHGLNEIAPTIDTLTTPAPDLTKILERRPKAKEFPIADMARIIDGRMVVKAHGPRQMPVWGEIYAEEGMDDDEIRGRKGELVAFLISIQKKD